MKEKNSKLGGLEIMKLCISSLNSIKDWEWQATVTAATEERKIKKQEISSLVHIFQGNQTSMQGVVKAMRLHGIRLRQAVLQHMMSTCNNNFSWTNWMTRFQTDPYDPTLPHKGLENITVAEVLRAKGEPEAGAVYWCRTTDSVYDAVRNMTEHNIGSLVVVKPGDEKIVAGILTERDYLKKIVIQERSSKETQVGEIMTDEKKLVTVNSGTKILQAMELMSDTHIRHVPVIDKRVIGMISIVDVIKAIVDQQHQEVKRLNDFIKGDYY